MCGLRIILIYSRVLRQHEISLIHLPLVVALSLTVILTPSF
jgi:hypothetical protein